MPSFARTLSVALLLLATSPAALAGDAPLAKACDVCPELVPAVVDPPMAKDCDACPIVPAAPPGTPMPADCDGCPDLVVIPAGTFRMGSPPDEPGRDDDEGPAREIVFDRPFALGRTEVTFAQWDACVADQACEPVADDEWGRATRPVINVSHPQAQGYAAWLAKRTGKSYRLPTEAEWEFAARAGTTGPRYWPATADGCGFANVYDEAAKAKYLFGWEAFTCTDGDIETAPVASHAPNAFGLYDMLGNVWEWVEDCHALTYAAAPTDGTAFVHDGCLKRVSRGGAWNNMPQWVRVSYRYGLEPDRRSNNLGFRVARDLP